MDYQAIFIVILLVVSALSFMPNGIIAYLLKNRLAKSKITGSTLINPFHLAKPGLQPVRANLTAMVAHLPQDQQKAKLETLSATLTYQGAVTALNMIDHCQRNHEAFGIPEKDAQLATPLGESLINLIESIEYTGE